MKLTLCADCRNGIATHFDNGGMLVRCSVGAGQPVVIHRPVTRCTDFEDKTLTDRYEMEKIAWRLTTDKKSAKVGFVPPKNRDVY